MQSDNKKIINNALTYHDNIREYQKYVGLIAYLVRVTGLPNNAISSVLIARKLMGEGLFSRTGNFIYNGDSTTNIEGFPGINVVTGMGNYLHIASFLSNVLTANGLDNSVLFCEVSDGINELTNSEVPNYAINLIQYNETLYGYDARRDILLTFGHDGNLHPIYSSENSRLAYAPITKIENADYAFDSKISSAEMIAKYSNNDVISSNRCESIRDYFNHNENKRYRVLLDTFQKNSIDRVNAISKKR